MAHYNLTDIEGIMVGREFVCQECCSDEEWDRVSEDEIVVKNDDDDTISFCDRCKKRV